jgi:general secretion pathway protein I
MSRGFTLLEVVVALAILGLALLAIFDLNAGAIASHAYAKRITIATMLARSKMTDIEQELYDKGFDNDDREISGDFRAEGWEAYTWKAQILAPRTTELSPDKLLEALFNIPPGADGVSGLASLLGGGRDGGVGGALSGLASSGALSNIQQQYGSGSTALPPGATGASGLQALGPFAALAQTQMQQLIQQIQRSVREVHLTVSWKDGRRTESIDVVNDVFSLRQGSDRNGTPGTPLSGGAPGAPGAQGVPGGQGVPGQNPFPGGSSFGNQLVPGVLGGPIRGNTPPGTPLDPQGRPIR